MKEKMNTQQSRDTNDGDTDVIVLGVGTSGEDISHQLLDAGLHVTGIEATMVGGECPYWACLPSKMMVRAANTLQEARRVGDLAGEASVHPDWNPVAEKIRALTGNWDDSGAVKRYEDRGGRMIKGHGKLTGPRTVAVGDESITARRGIVIATGSKVFVPPIPGLDEIEYWTTHDVIEMKKLPKSIIVLGGGTSGCELGQVLERFGVEVTIVEAEEHLLSKEEPEASEIVEAAFADEGIGIHTGKKVERFESRDGLVVAVLSDGEEISAERLFVATGRKIDLSGIGLESIGLDPEAPNIKVDERMHVADGIWAMGDITGKSLLTHVGLYQSAIIVADILGQDHPPARYDAVPRAIFVDPEVGSVGKTEEEARNEGIDLAVVVKQIPLTFRGAVYGEKRGIIKLVVDRNKGVLIGATVAGSYGTEMLGFLHLAVHARIPLTEMRAMMYAFPAFYSAIGEALGTSGRGLTTVLDPDYKGRKILDEVISKI